MITVLGIATPAIRQFLAQPVWAPDGFESSSVNFVMRPIFFNAAFCPVVVVGNYRCSAGREFKAMNPIFIGEVVDMLACEIEQLFVDGMAKFGRENEKAAGFLGVH